jgi:hypothetical protein
MLVAYALEDRSRAFVSINADPAIRTPTASETRPLLEPVDHGVYAVFGNGRKFMAKYIVAGDRRLTGAPPISEVISHYTQSVTPRMAR